MRQITPLFVAVLVAGGGSAIAQGLPSAQPPLLQIYREEVKPGHTADHVKVEAGWVAAFERAKFPYYSLAYVSVTGPDEAWFIVPFESHEAMGDAMKRQSDDPAMAAELPKLQRADADHVSATRSIQASARKDLGRGAFPDIAKQRFWEITTFHVKPGHESAFEAAAKAYGSAAERSAPTTTYRVYEVIAGVPGPTYFVFTSTTSFADFDKMMSEGEATMKGATAEERQALQTFSKESLISAETQRFRLDPEMSYVPKEIRAQDPAFWSPKRPAAKPSSQP